jgi:urate oxidase
MTRCYVLAEMQMSEIVNGNFPSAYQIVDNLIVSSTRSAREEIMRQFDMHERIFWQTIS